MRVDADHIECGADELVENQDDGDSDENPEINSLSRVSTDQLGIAGTIVSRRDRRDGHQNTETNGKTEEPDTAAYSDGRQCFGAESPSHHRVREMYAGY